MSDKRISRRSDAGFSLLEVLVVLAIMSVAAYVALDSVDHDSSQMRFDLTETRLAKIRRAVVGDPNLVLNGSPMVSGYVADVGQLPPCLLALVEQIADCDDDGTVDVDPPVFATVAGLSFGWRGPYLTDGPDGIFDAWGNVGDASEDYGWEVAVSGTTFDVSSLGRDRALGGAGPFDSDPAMLTISEDDYQTDLGGWTISAEVTNSSDTAALICTAIVTPNPDDATEWQTLPDRVAAAVNVPVGGTVTVSQLFVSDETVTIGRRPIIVFTPASGSNCNVGGGMGETPGATYMTRNVLIVPRVTPADVTLTVTIP